MWKGRKTPRIFIKKINPIWFPSHPPICDVEGRLFSDIQTGAKTSRTIPMGRGPKLTDKRKAGEAGLGKGNMNYSNGGLRSSKNWGWKMVWEVKRMEDGEDLEN